MIESVVYPFYSIYSKMTVEGKKSVGCNFVCGTRRMKKCTALESDTEDFLNGLLDAWRLDIQVLVIQSSSSPEIYSLMVVDKSQQKKIRNGYV